MKKECVFKCQIHGLWYRVYECVNPDDKGWNYYQTYIGKKRLDHRTWSCLGSAIGSILTVADESAMNDMKVVWE